MTANGFGMESNFNDLKTIKMNTEQKEKLMLADDLTAYINEKHTQEECTGFIDGYNSALAKLKLFSIPVVVGTLPCDECENGKVWSPYYAKYVECDCRK